MTLFGKSLLSTPSVILLIMMNLIPLFGVYFLGWDVGTLLLLYWLESLIIGILNIPKILLARGQKSGRSSKVSFGGKLYLAFFFSFHFGAFCFGHYIFLDSFFETVPAITEFGTWLFSTQGLMMSAVGLFLSHLFSMFRNFYGKGEYKTRTPNRQMMLPYSRIFIMHFVIIMGGALISSFHQHIWALILLVGLKIAIDIVSHLKEHQ